jgi:hypothetical protein
VLIRTVVDRCCSAMIEVPQWMANRSRCEWRLPAASIVMRSAFIVVSTVGVLLVLAAPLRAQTDDVSLKLPTIVFGAAAAGDWATTYYATSHLRFHEDNPLLTALSQRPKTLVLAGAGIDVAGVTLWNHFVGRKHPRFAQVGLYLAAGFRVGLAARNLHRISRQLDAPNRTP